MGTETFGSESYLPSNFLSELMIMPSDTLLYNIPFGGISESGLLADYHTNDNLPTIGFDSRNGSIEHLRDSDDDEDTIDSQGWMNKPIGVWNESDTKRWLYTASKEIGQLYRQISPKLAIPGAELQFLSRQDFIEHDSRYGGKLYDLLSKHKNRVPEHHEYTTTSKLPEPIKIPELKVTLIDETPSESDSSSGDEFVKRPNRRVGRPSGKKQKEVRPKIWEFIRDLLLDPTTCPEWIKWENYEDKTFLFVESQKVAQRWGARRDNADMNFEKFSRLMRYYYKKGYLAAVHGRRLVYRFGPNATGLETTNPNFNIKSAAENLEIYSLQHTQLGQ